MVDVPRLLADEPAGHPSDEILRRHVDQDGPVDAAAALGKGGIERLGLGPRPGKAVEDGAPGGIGLVEAVEEHPDGDVVGHELAAVHVATGVAADGGALSEGRSEEVAGGDVRDPETLAQDLGLGPLPRAWGTEEQRARWLPQMATGEVLACFGLTEPDFGSDPANLQSTAVKTPEGGYRINGRKIFGTQSIALDQFFSEATWTDSPEGETIITFIIPPRDTPGLVFKGELEQVGAAPELWVGVEPIDQLEGGQAGRHGELVGERIEDPRADRRPSIEQRDHHCERRPAG